MYWYSYIVYFVCDPASEFGAMGSTPFLGFYYPNLLIDFLNLLYFRNLYHIFLAARSVGILSGSFFILSLFFCTIIWVSLKGQVYKSSTSTYDLQTILVQDFVPIRTVLRGGEIASSSFVLFSYLLYWYYSYIIYFVCAPASEFGAMGSTSFLGFSYSNLLLVFLKILSKKLRFLSKILFPREPP